MWFCHRQFADTGTIVEGVGLSYGGRIVYGMVGRAHVVPQIQRAIDTNHRPLHAYSLLGPHDRYALRHAPRVEKEKSQKANSIAIAAERKRQGKLRRARERERRKIAAFEKERHEEEMARIER